MGKEYDNLTSEQQAAFNTNMARFGMAPTDLIHHDTLDTADFNGNLILSPDPEESHVPPILVPVKNIAELKKMRGIPDEHYTSKQYSDRTIDYPPELPEHRAALAATAENECDLEYQLTPEEHKNIHKAAESYMLGNSAKVKSYEPMINALMFPGQVACVTGDNLIVRAGQTVTIKPRDGNPNDTICLNYAKITVETGGQIVVKAKCDVTTQIFIADATPGTG